MAVPFSRPAYPRRPQPSQNQRPNPRPSITSFLNGQSGIQLDQLSLTSRIAFYALYEAYRLLMDLTSGNPALNHQEDNQQTSHTIYRRHNQDREVFLPDLIPPTSNLNRNPTAQDSTQSLNQPRVCRQQNYHHHHHCQAEPAENKCPPPPEAQAQALPSSKPDFILDIISDEHEDETDFVSRRPDVLFCAGGRRSISTSSDYFSLDGTTSEFDYQSDEEDEDEEDCKKAVNWHNLGNQLCQIASAFEVTYEHRMSRKQKEIYSMYRDLKLKSLALSRQDTTMSGLAKTICRHVLLSTIWLLIKKIM